MKFIFRMYRLSHCLSLASASPPFITWLGRDDVLYVPLICNSNYLYGKITATLCSMNIMLLTHIFLRNDPYRNIVGEDQEFLTSDPIKQHFKVRCVKYNCTLYIWAAFFLGGGGARKNEQYLWQNIMIENCR